MAGIDDVFKGSLITAAAVGVGAVLLAPVAMPIFVSIGRPLAKSTIKAGLIFYNRGRETFAELSEVFDDLVAEAQAELQTESDSAPDARTRAASEASELHRPTTASQQQTGPRSASHS